MHGERVTKSLPLGIPGDAMDSLVSTFCGGHEMESLLGLGPVGTSRRPSKSIVTPTLRFLAVAEALRRCARGSRGFGEPAFRVQLW